MPLPDAGGGPGAPSRAGGAAPEQAGISRGARRRSRRCRKQLRSRVGPRRKGFACIAPSGAVGTGHFAPAADAESSARARAVRSCCARHAWLGSQAREGVRSRRRHRVEDEGGAPSVCNRAPDTARGACRPHFTKNLQRISGNDELVARPRCLRAEGGTGPRPATVRELNALARGLRGAAEVERCTVTVRPHGLRRSRGGRSRAATASR